jgi:iron complex outermembrane recepter protein
MRAWRVMGVVLGLLLMGSPAHGQEAPAQKVTLNIAAQPVSDALNEFALQAGFQGVFYTSIGKGLTSPQVSGVFTPEQALKRLLGNTSLRYRFINPHTIAIQEAAVIPAMLSERISAQQAGGPERALRLAQAAAVAEESVGRKRRAIAPMREDVTLSLPEILVSGSRSLNMDIVRTRDDAQPYVVFDRETIARSGVTNLEEFFKTRLTASVSAVSSDQNPLSFGGNQSQINLRGLGTNQTLILVDGHRRASSVGHGSGTPLQPDINGIPLSAIERIEVLPTTASGIYGGGATGGVINIVMRRDYTGTELQVGYDGTFDGGGATRRADLNSGFSFEDGKSSLFVAASYSDANPLLFGDRDLVQRGRARVMANNAAFYLTNPNPPLGATTNIRSVSGAPLIFDDLTPLGSAITYIPPGYAGTTTDQGAALRANAGQYNFDLAQTSQIATAGARAALITGSTIKSLAATLRRQFGSRVQGFLDMGVSSNLASAPRNAFTGWYTIQANAPNNPFNAPIRVATPLFTDGEYEMDLRDHRAVGGVIVALPRDWQAEADYTWNRVRQFGNGDLNGPTTGPDVAAVGNGSVDVMRDTNLFPADFGNLLNGEATYSPRHTTLEDATVRFAGPLWSLPAGAMTLSTLLSHRRERIDTSTATLPTLTQTLPGRSQSTDSVYFEVKLPIFSAQKKVRGVEELDLQLALRRDDYTLNGSTNVISSTAPAPIGYSTNKLSSTDPTFAVRYRPLRDVMFRASFGTGFLPPGVDQIVTSAPNPLGTRGLRDPRRGNEAISSGTLLTGGNPELRPEESESWSAGVVFTPRVVSGLRLSIDWSRIHKSDNIVTLTPNQAFLDQENVLTSRFVRAAPAPGDPFGVGRITLIDATNINIARARIEAWDAALDYTLSTQSLGTFDVFGALTWLPRYETQVLPTQPFIDSVGVGSSVVNLSTGGPLEYRANAGLTWSRRGLRLTWLSRYFESYLVSTNATNIANQGDNGRVPSQVYHDVSASYTFGAAAAGGVAGWLADTEVRLGIRNVFNKKPPVDVNFTNTFYSSFADPRLATYYVSIRHGF